MGGVVLKDGIDVGRYRFSEDRRRKIRVGDQDSLVVGCVARLSDQKNQSFLIEVFSYVVRLRPDARLWLIGDGPMRGELEAQVHRLGMEERVVFFGARDDVDELLQGIDVFVLPSVWEGLGIALIEAQAMGLPCIASDRVPEEADVPGCIIEHLSLEEPPARWARQIVRHAGMRTQDATALVKAAGYGLAENARELEQLYWMDERGNG